jgi:type II secretory pathway component PulF
MIEIDSAWASLEEAIIKAQFGAETRIEFYEGMQSLIENRVNVKMALQELYGVWSDNGKSKKAALALICQDLGVQVSNGTSLSRALSRWAPFEEVSLIAAGEQSGRLVEAFDDAIRVLTSKQKIRSALSGLIYPLFLTIPLSAVLWIISTEVVPKVAKTSDPEGWTGSAYLLYLLSSFVTNYGIALVCLLAIFAIGISYSLPRLRGQVRIIFDKLPVYSTYRMVHGSTFLINISVMMRASHKLRDSLELLEQYASPWMKERVEGALYGIRQGANLGIALENAGHNFPDKRAIQYIRILASRDGFAESLSKYSERWLASSIKRIERTAVLVRNIMLIMLGIVMALVVLGTQELQSNFDKSAHQATQSIQQ